VCHDLGRREPLPIVPGEARRGDGGAQAGARLGGLRGLLRGGVAARGARPGVVGGDGREVLVKEEGALRLIDDAADVVGRLPEWVGLLWLSAMPARLLLAFLWIRLIELGPEAVHYGDWVRRMAWLLLLAWLGSLWGRQVFVGACRHALQSERPAPRALLRVPTREMAGHLAAALAVEVLFWALLPTLVAPLFLLVPAGLAAAAAPAGGPGPLESLGALWRGIGPVGRLIRLVLLFAVLVPVAAINLHFFAGALIWLAGGVASFDVTGWRRVLDWGVPSYRVLLLIGALLLLEPVWLAALTVHVERVRARGTGDDLRRWFAELRAAG